MSRGAAGGCRLRPERPFQVTERFFHSNEMAGLYGRVLKIRPSRREVSPAEPWGRSALSGQAKRRRILEEARTAVLEWIRHAR